MGGGSRPEDASLVDYKWIILTNPEAIHLVYNTAFHMEQSDLVDP